MTGEACKALYYSHFIPAWLLWNVQKLCNKSESNTLCWNVVLKCFPLQQSQHFIKVKSFQDGAISGESTCHLRQVDVMWFPSFISVCLSVTKILRRNWLIGQKFCRKMTDFCKNIIGLLTQGTHDDMLIIYLFSTMTFHKCFYHVKTFEITLKKMIRKLFFRLNLKSYQFKQSIQFHTYFSCTYHVQQTKQ